MMVLAGLPASAIAGEQVLYEAATPAWAKPVDLDLLRELARSHEAIVTVEEGCVQGGAGSAVMEALQAEGFTLPVLSLGLPDVFIEHGDPAKLLALQGLVAAGIERSVRERFGVLLDGASGLKVVA